MISTPYKLIGQLLIEKELLTPAQLEEAFTLRLHSKKRLGQILVEQGYVSYRAIADCLAEQFSLPVVDLATIKPSKAALSVVPVIVALSHLVLPYKSTKGRLWCVVADPLDIETTDRLTYALNSTIELSIGPADELKAKIYQAYGLQAPSPEGSVVKKNTKSKIDQQADRDELLFLWSQEAA